MTRAEFPASVKKAVRERSGGQCEVPAWCDDQTSPRCCVHICYRPAHSNDLCIGHLGRIQHGKPLAPEQPLKSTPREVQQFLKYALSRKSKKCLSWPFSDDGKGYGQMTHNGKKTRPHRVICELANGEPNGDVHAAHSCGNRGCCNPSHIRWATPAENIKDKARHGTQLRGTQVINSKLSPKKVRVIRMSLHSNLELARRYKVSRATIDDARAGRTWRHVK